MYDMNLWNCFPPDLQSNDSALLLIAYDAEGKMRIRPKRLMHRQGMCVCLHVFVGALWEANW